MQSEPVRREHRLARRPQVANEGVPAVRHQLGGDTADREPGAPGVLARLRVHQFAAPGTGSEDDSKEPVGRFYALGAVDDARDPQRRRVDGQPGLFLQFARGGVGDELAFVCLS